MSFYGQSFIQTSSGGNSAIIPAGLIAMWSGGTSAPTGWALCDGGTYAKVDGSGNLTAPDLRGRFVLGYNASASANNSNDSNSRSGPNTLNSVAGEYQHTITTSEMPSHTHTGTTSWVGDHAHSVSINKDYGEGRAALDSADTGDFPGGYETYVTSGSGAHNHTFTTEASGSGSAHNLMPPYYVLAYIIKL